MTFAEIWFGIGLGIVAFIGLISLMMGGDLFAFGKWTLPIILAAIVMGPLTILVLIAVADD